jgi:hypothetical protein
VVEEPAKTWNLQDRAGPQGRAIPQVLGW